jgi:hypothetical protein
MPERVPSDLADARILNEQGEPIRLGDLWRDRTVVLAFVRHFG